jgi:hypothetical protein
MTRPIPAERSAIPKRSQQQHQQHHQRLLPAPTAISAPKPDTESPPESLASPAAAPSSRPSAQSRKPLTRYRRKAEVPFLLTERDLAVLQAVDRCRYLRTGQIHRLVFPDCRSNQSARRRLKYLYHNGYLGRVTPFLQAGQGSAEMAYFLDRTGADCLREAGLPVRSPPTRDRSARNGVRRAYPAHTLDIAEFRVQLECALRDHPILELHRFVADFELTEPTRDAIGNRRYRLHAEVCHPVSKQSYQVYPDALLILRGRGDYRAFQRLVFLEIDRGTAPLHVIREKVIGYNLYRQHGIHRKFGRFDRFRVLLQTSSPKRAGNIRSALTDQDGADLVWVTDVAHVTPETVLEGEVWLDAERRLRSVLKRPSG